MLPPTPFLPLNRQPLVYLRQNLWFTEAKKKKKTIEVPDKQASAGKAKRERDASLFMVASIYIANELVGCCGFASLSYRGCLTNISGQVPKIYSLSSFHFNFAIHFYKSYKRGSAKGNFITVETLWQWNVILRPSGWFAMWSARSSLYQCFGGSYRPEYHNGIKIIGYEMDEQSLTLISDLGQQTNCPYSFYDPHNLLCNTYEGAQHDRIGEVKFTLEHATKVQRESRCIALLFFQSRR